MVTGDPASGEKSSLQECMPIWKIPRQARDDIYLISEQKSRDPSSHAAHQDDEIRSVPEFYLFSDKWH